jgi:hypothetical protein
MDDKSQATDCVDGDDIPKKPAMPQDAPPESDFEDIPDEIRFSRKWNRRMLLNQQASQSSTVVHPDLSRTSKKAIRFTAFSPRLALPSSTPTLPFPIPHIRTRSGHSRRSPQQSQRLGPCWYYSQSRQCSARDRRQALVRKNRTESPKHVWRQ